MLTPGVHEVTEAAAPHEVTVVVVWVPVGAIVAATDDGGAATM